MGTHHGRCWQQCAAQISTHPAAVETPAGRPPSRVRGSRQGALSLHHLLPSPPLPAGQQAAFPPCSACSHPPGLLLGPRGSDTSIILETVTFPQFFTVKQKLETQSRDRSRCAGRCYRLGGPSLRMKCNRYKSRCTGGLRGVQLQVPGELPLPGGPATWARSHSRCVAGLGPLRAVLPHGLPVLLPTAPGSVPAVSVIGSVTWNKALRGPSLFFPREAV